MNSHTVSCIPVQTQKVCAKFWKSKSQNSFQNCYNSVYLPSKTESSRSKMYRDFKIKEGCIILHVLSLQKTLNKSMLVLDNDPTVLNHAHLFCHIADLNTYL